LKTNQEEKVQRDHFYAIVDEVDSILIDEARTPLIISGPTNRDQNHYRDGEIIIVDEFTGRLSEGRRYSEGLHQALEAKEGVEIKEESQTLAEVTYQNYFRQYNKLAGMTGTAQTEATEFAEIYGLDVISIPTNVPVERIKIDDEVRELGGLVILGTERHESRRIDNQLRGRAGRQGDPGESQFLESRKLTL